MAEALGGFCYATHWEGSPNMIDWYAAPLGTPIGWPEGGTVYTTSLVGPDGPDDPMETAWLVGDSGLVYTFTHVQNIRAGRHEKWDAFADVGVSGIAALPGDPAHIHFAASANGWPQFSPDGPVGSLAALPLLQQMGFGIDVLPGRAPGPQDYLSGKAVAGRWV